MRPRRQPLKIIGALGPHVSSRAVVGREVPLRVLGEALDPPLPGAVARAACRARPGSARRGSWARSRRARARLPGPARRVPRARRRGAGLRAGRRRAAGSAGGVDARLARELRSRRAARWPRCCRASRPAPAVPGGCTSCCSTCSAGSRPSARRCCSCSRTSTGPTRRRSRCSRSWPATCATSGSRSSPPTASTTRCRPRCAGSRAELSRRRTVLRIELEPLGRDDVARQLEAIAGAPVPGRAGGRAARARGRQPVLRRGAVRRPRRAPRRRVTEAVLARVERLDGAALALLAAAGGHASPRAARAPRGRAGRAAGGARRRRARARAATASRSGTG